MDLNGDSWTIQCEVVQGPPLEDLVPDELELESVVPFDFFVLRQPAIQQEQDDKQNLNEQEENANMQQE